MALNPLNSSNLEQLALKGLMWETTSLFLHSWHGAEPFEQQQFGTTGVEGVNAGDCQFCTPGVEILQSTVAVAVADDDSDVKSSARCLLNVFRLSFWR